MENTGSTRLCAATFDVRLGGFEQSALLHGPQYILPDVALTFPFVEPGDRGVIRALLHDAMKEDLLAATTLTISRSNDPVSGMGETRYDLTTLIDARGLLIAELDVPSYGPTDGGAALSAGVPEELESDVVGCELVDFVVMSENYFEP